MSERTNLHDEVQALRDEVRTLTKQVSGLVEAWQTAQGVVKFMKWLGGAATALTALWVLLKMAFDMRGGK